MVAIGSLKFKMINVDKLNSHINSAVRVHTLDNLPISLEFYVVLLMTLYFFISSLMNDTILKHRKYRHSI